MRKFLFLILIIASCASFASAQEDSRFEIFGGYSLQRPVIVDDGDSANLNGFNIATTGYINERFGITGDFSAHFNSESIDFPPVRGENSLRTFNYLIGPQVRFTNSSRVTPFVRALVGAQTNRVRFESATTAAPSFTESSTDAALALGGGLDVRVSPRVAIRAFQIDYNPVFARNSFTDDRDRVDNVRISVGIVFR